MQSQQIDWPSLARAAAETPAGEGSAIGELIGIRGIFDQLWHAALWAQSQLASVNTLIQLAIILVALVPATIFGPQIRKLIVAQVAPRAPYGALRRAANAFAHIATPIALYLIWQGASLALAASGRSHGVIDAGVSLLAAWIVIRLVTLIIRSAFWSRVAFFVAWPIAALDATNLLDDAMRLLDSASIPLGTGATGLTTTFSADRKSVV